MEGIEISIGRVGARRDIALLRVKGYIDTQTCGKMLNVITQVLQDGAHHIIVDMGQVNYVSSAGWGVFVGEIKGIRESGGDLKIVQMLPEVNEVFEMLEFNRILASYDNIEEAIDDFDLSIGLDITKSISRTYRADNGGSSTEAVAPPAPPPRKPEKSPAKGRKSFVKPKIDARVLPLSEQIKIAVIEDPIQGALKIKKTLDTEKYGFKKVGYFKILRTLRKLNLETKEKRIRFYRSR
ncbi:MAG: STAS domain-containing protein [Deferribacteres bacterium]|nr:STAS domain-containing protein [candidate division KSB1 bacterium]MCB9510257.1 STAS domain-containing protein [Deferribacteres bacterium]